MTEKGPYSITDPNFVSIILSLYLYSTFSKTPKKARFSKSEGCALFLSFGEAR
jgi:hypothetical protein